MKFYLLQWFPWAVDLPHVNEFSVNFQGSPLILCLWITHSLPMVSTISWIALKKVWLYSRFKITIHFCYKITHALSPFIQSWSLMFFWLLKNTLSGGKIYLCWAYFYCIFIFKFSFNCLLDINLTGWQTKVYITFVYTKFILYLFSEPVEASTTSPA